MTTRQQVAKVVAANAKYYGKDLSEIEFAFYLHDLAGLDPHLVSAAFEQHRRSGNGRFMPKTCELLAIITANTSHPLDPLEAWQEVLMSFRTSCRPSFGQRIQRAINECGGLSRIGMARVGHELDTIRAKFIAALQATEIKDDFRHDALLRFEGDCRD